MVNYGITGIKWKSVSCPYTIHPSILHEVLMGCKLAPACLHMLVPKHIFFLEKHVYFFFQLFLNTNFTTKYWNSMTKIKHGSNYSDGGLNSTITEWVKETKLIELVTCLRGVLPSRWSHLLCDEWEEFGINFWLLLGANVWMTNEKLNFIL